MKRNCLIYDNTSGSWEVTYIICTESWPHQIPLPSLNLSSGCSSLSQALNTLMAQLDYAQGILFRLPQESVIVFILSTYKF
jgi:hypothetical protein